MMSDDAEANPIVLRGMTWDHPRGVDGLQASNALLAEHHGAMVDWEVRSLLDFGDQHIADFASEFDVMVIDHPHVPDAVDGRALLALDQYLAPDRLAVLERESVGRSHESYAYRGHQWGLAIDAAAQVSVFRPDLVDGVSPYWSDILRLAAEGSVLWPYKPVDAFSTFATLLAQHGTPLADPQAFLDLDAAAAVLEIMIELAAHVPEWCARANPIEVAEALSTSSDHSVGVALFGYTNYAREGFRPYRLVYDDIPSFDGRAAGSTLGGAGIAVSSKTRNPRLAVTLAEELAASAAQTGAYTVGGGQPGNLRAWKSAQLDEFCGGFFGRTLRTHERAWVRPRLLGWPDLQLELSHIVHECLVARAVSVYALDRLEALPGRYLNEAVA